ncbi:MAG: hypothetical protein AB7J13_01470 [Pyrinomonadaceae bacterium]
MNKAVFLPIFALVALFLTAAPTSAQRDYLTPEEVELIRDAQQIDNRIEILTTAIDRRFEVLNLNVGATKRVKKTKSGDKEEWGAMPTGTRFELLLDIKRILQKSIDEIDNLADRPNALTIDPDEKKPKSFEELFPKAVRSLADAAKRYAPVLKGELDKNNDPGEKGSVLDSLEMCSQIIDSVNRLPAKMNKAKGK